MPGVVEKRDVLTTLNYWKDPGNGEGPAPIVIGGGRITNKRPHCPYDFIVKDVGQDIDQYNLDSHGFQYVSHKSAERDFTDDDVIESKYYEECREIIRRATGANRVHIFNHKVRRGPTQWHHLGFNNLVNRGPVTRTHVDQSYEGAELRLRHELPREADDSLNRRYQIINVWRPIATILKDPIAVANSSTVPDADLVEAEMTEDGFQGKQWVVRHNPDHQWYYKYRMATEEVLLIKCFDSRLDVARRALHTAFEDPEYRDEVSRQSIEVRCLVLHDGA